MKNDLPLCVCLHGPAPFDQRFCLSSLFDTYFSDTGSGQERTEGNFDGELLCCTRQGPDPAHLRALWWNNSKCLSCIVWHAAGGVLKLLLPAPKAPLNKIVKNNSFTLIFPSDYCTPGGKLAAGLSASVVFRHCYIFIWESLPLSPQLLFAIHPSLFLFSGGFITRLFVWRTRWTLWDKCEGRVGLLRGLFYWVSIRSNMWLIGGCIFHSLLVISEETQP